MSEQLNIRQACPKEDRASIESVLGRCLPDAISAQRYEWAYLQNPGGVARVWLAETSAGKPVGTSAAFPRKFSVNGNELLGLVLSDFAIDSSFRSLGPALKLLKETLSVVKNGEYDIALDHPSQGMKALYRRFSAIDFGEQQRFVKLLRLNRILENRWGKSPAGRVAANLGNQLMLFRDALGSRNRSYRAEYVEGVFTEEHARLASGSRKSTEIFGERSADYLNWRFGAGGRFSYKRCELRREGKLVAFAVLRILGEVTDVVEYFDGAELDLRRTLMGAVARLSRQNGAEALQASAFENGHWQKMLIEMGFSGREHSAGPVAVVSPTSVAKSAIADVKNWWITDGDRDG